MRNLLFFILFTAILPISLLAQRQMENLGRGLIAVKIDNGVYVNWRITAQEWQGVSYNLYRDGTLLNSSPITGASNYTDTAGTLTSTYQVAAVVKGVEQERCAAVTVHPNPYIQIDLREIPKIPGVSDEYYDWYSINDATVADLDGDGEYEIIFKRVNEGFKRDEPFANQYYTLFEAYKLDGTHMWTIDVGPNVFNGVEINMLAYDFDGDGKAEVVMRSSEGTIDGVGNMIGDVGNADGDLIPDGITNYRDHIDGYDAVHNFYEAAGPEFISLYDGETGRELDRAEMIRRYPIEQWGSTGAGAAHRSTKYMWGAPYLDGIKPSIFIGRGIYETIKWTAFDVVVENGEKKLKQRWDVIDLGGEYYQQGNHNFSIADVDGDGCDEIIYGQMTINNDGSGLYSTRLGHGDAIHVGDFDPYRKGLEIMACLENEPYWGTTFRAAEDGTILLQWIRGQDQGRCMAANVTNDYPGALAWPPSGNSQHVWAVSLGEEVEMTQGSQNFRIYWDGDLLEELVDHTWVNDSVRKGTGLITKYVDGVWKNLLSVDYFSCNDTKGTPCLQADIFGDWREEIIWRSDDDTNVRIYFTDIPTEHRIYTLMHDPQYRNAIAWQMVGYNQPPHTSYFLGERENILLPPPPVVSNDKLLFASGNTWDFTSSAWTRNGVPTIYSDAEEVLFDYSILAEQTDIAIPQPVAPENLTVNTRYAYNFVPENNGKLTGAMKFIKQGSGTAILHGEHDYTGTTEVWDGLFSLRGTLVNSPVWLNRFGELESDGIISQGITLEYGAILYPGLKGVTGTMEIVKSLVLNDNAVINFDIASTVTDQITINGDLILGSDVRFVINNIGTTLQEGTYPLVTFTGNLSGNVSDIRATGPDGYRMEISQEGNQLLLTVVKLREPTTLVWQGAQNNGAWDFDTANFLLNGVAERFVQGDTVIFNDSGIARSVNLLEDVQIGGIIVETSGEYSINGTRNQLTGDGSLTINSGTLRLPGTNSYTGATYVNEGAVLEIATFPTAAASGSIGVANSDPDMFVVNGGRLINIAGQATQNSARALRIGEKGATLEVNSDVTFNALVTGGKLIKEGAATLSTLVTATDDYTTVDYSESVIREGTLQLRSEFAKPGNKVTFEGGTLQCYNSTSSYSSAYWDIVVEEGQTGTLHLDGRCDYYGTLTGSGRLTLGLPFIRNIIMGDWSAFTGTLTVVKTGNEGTFTYTNANTLPNANVWFEGTSSGNLYAENVTGGTFAGSVFQLGSMNSNEYVTLNGAWTWEVGNINTNSTFNGIIQNSASLRKVGTGALTLTGASTYTGTTTVNAGTLLAANTTGSATGTSAVTVNSGATLGGNGFIDGAVTIAAGGILQPGDHTSGNVSDMQATLTFSGNLTLASGSTLQISLLYASAGGQHDTVSVKGTLNVSGSNLVVISADGTPVPAGVEIRVIDGTINGTFGSTELPATATGVTWDTSDLYTSGVIRTVAN